MNKKTIIIAVGLAIAIILAILTYGYSVTNDKKPAPATPTAQSTTTGKNTPSNPTIFNSAKGTVRTNNFLAKPIFTTDTTVVIADTDQYQIVYLKNEGAFEILIAAPPANMSRNQAENSFIKLLNVSKEDACKLPVVTKVPYAVDPDLAGPEYGLSFCNPNIKK